MASATASTVPAAATKDAPFLNSLGMKFVPVPITGGPTDKQRVLFSVWETRVQDYGAFALETKREWKKADFTQGLTHPAVMVSWNDAQAFCAWLTQRERRAGKIGTGEQYRLPTDHEWSCMVGIGDREDASQLPEAKSRGFPGLFPWGKAWPPPAGTANLPGEEAKSAAAAQKYSTLKGAVTGYRDAFVETAPVGSFAPNQFGLFDVSGNVYEWCEEIIGVPGIRNVQKVMRGAAWNSSLPNAWLSAYRHSGGIDGSNTSTGFRCVLAPTR